MALNHNIDKKNGLVDRHINTAYDTVKLVSDNITDVINAGQNISDISIVSQSISSGELLLAISAPAKTAADVITTNANVVITNADSNQTQADALSTAADVLLASKWANNAENIIVASGQYSAFHWAKKSQASATGSLTYQGPWNASTGAYPIGSVLGEYYKVNVGGTVDGVLYNIGDDIIRNNSGGNNSSADWDKVDNTDAVTSVGGFIGDITDAQLLSSITSLAAGDVVFINNVTFSGRTVFGGALAVTPVPYNETIQIGVGAFLSGSLTSEINILSNNTYLDAEGNDTLVNPANASSLIRQNNLGIAFLVAPIGSTTYVTPLLLNPDGTSNFNGDVTFLNSNIGIGVTPTINLEVGSTRTTNGIEEILRLGTTVGGTQGGVLKISTEFGASPASRSVTLNAVDEQSNAILLDFQVGGISGIFFNTNANIGIKSSPDTWGNLYTGLNIGGNGAISNKTIRAISNELNITENAYNDGINWVYMSATQAVNYRQTNGGHFFDVAVIGTAGGIVSWLPKVAIDISGTTFFNDIFHGDNSHSYWGNTNALDIYHNLTNSLIVNTVGQLNISEEVISGLIQLDTFDQIGVAKAGIIIGGAIPTVIMHQNGLEALRTISNGVSINSNLDIFHNGFNGDIVNYIGDLVITNNVNSLDVIISTPDSGAINRNVIVCGASGGATPIANLLAGGILEAQTVLGAFNIINKLQLGGVNVNPAFLTGVSPVFTVSPSAPTQAANSNNTLLATTAYADTAAVLTNYTGARNDYTISDSAATFELNIDAITPGTWVTIGPTGSGATMIWTALNDLPLTAKNVRLRIVNLALNNAGVSVTASVFARQNGSVIGAENRSMVSRAYVNNIGSGGSSVEATDINEFTVKIGASNIFDVLINTTSISFHTCQLVVVGYTN